MAPQSKKGSSKSPKSRRKGRKGKAAAASETESVDLNNGDYNIRSPERTELLSQLQEVIGNTPVTPAFWACCQLADMNCLRDIANSSSRVVLPLRKPVSTIVMRWSQRFRDSEFPGSEAASRRSEGPKRRKLNSDAQPSMPRSVKEAQNCKDRDDHRCVLTRRPHPQAAHIFPYSMLRPRPKSDRNKTSNAMPEFWESLRIFWDEDRVNKWKSTIFPDSENPDIGVERCFNLISLSPDAHDMWNRGLFALKPLGISPNHEELTVQFFWQIPGNYDIDGQVNLLTEPSSSKGLDHIADGYILIRFEEEGLTPRFRPIFSGDVLTFTTKDPKNLPLPSVELLEMQWVLQRLTGMCGTAGWPSVDCGDDDSDNDDSWLIPDSTDYEVHNSLKRAYEWVGAEEAEGTTMEISAATPGLPMVQCR